MTSIQERETVSEELDAAAGGATEVPRQRSRGEELEYDLEPTIVLGRE
ncbi:hypothetical protein [Amycolatopsis magusensis]|nr:hypothetical protein L3Q67_23915 [Saccharothrix sp. AJ9571]